MPVLLTTAAEIECWLEGLCADSLALALQRPMAEDVVELMPEEKEAIPSSPDGM